MENKTLSTVCDLARRFKRQGLTIAWLKAEARANRIPHFKAGKRFLFDPDAVEEALLKRARQQDSQEVAK